MKYVLILISIYLIISLVFAEQKISAKDGIILMSPDGNCWIIKVSNAGALSSESENCI